MTYLYKMQSCLIIVMASFFVLSSSQAMQTEFQPPSLEGFNPHDERDADGDGDGVNETHITQYFDASGDSIVSMSTKGIVWAWSLETRDAD